MIPDKLLRALTPEERAQVDELLSTDPMPWRPLDGPQSEAAESPADIIGFGGSAGGGKTDLACGLAVTEHRRVAIFRETGTELVAIKDRLRELIGPRGKYNGVDKIWSLTRHDGIETTIELGAFPDDGDEKKYQGRPHDLLVFDEASNMRQHQVRFLFGWLRTTVAGQRKRILLTFNPPTDVEGRWVVQFFAPWLDDKHPNPAVPGELRWFGVVNGVDVEVPDSRPFVLKGSTRIYEFDRDDYSPEDIVEPMSRTFIPSRIKDNPFLSSTGYMRTLQALPEPLRSQMLKGDFKAGLKDDAFQVIPTAWVEAAMARWKKPDRLPPMDSLGADIAMGGSDEHVIMRRHGFWFDEPIAHPGGDIPNGAKSASLIVAAMRNSAVLHIDLFGVGAQTYGYLMQLGLQTVGVNFGETTAAVDEDGGRLRFFNLRSLLWWRMREALDPLRNNGIALPPHRRLLADLCALKWSLPGQKIKVQSRDDTIKSIGRSPDYGTACVLALIDTPKRQAVLDIFGRKPGAQMAGHDPMAVFEGRDP